MMNRRDSYRPVSKPEPSYETLRNTVEDLYRSQARNREDRRDLEKKLASTNAARIRAEQVLTATCDEVKRKNCEIEDHERTVHDLEASVRDLRARNVQVQRQLTPIIKENNDLRRRVRQLEDVLYVSNLARTAPPDGTPEFGSFHHPQ